MVHAGTIADRSNGLCQNMQAVGVKGLADRFSGFFVEHAVHHGHRFAGHIEKKGRKIIPPFSARCVDRPSTCSPVVCFYRPGRLRRCPTQFATEPAYFASPAFCIPSSSFLISSGEQLRPVHLDRQLVELGGQGERRLVVGIVDAGQRTQAEAVILEVEFQRMLAGRDASGPSHLIRSRSIRFQRNTGLPSNR